MDPEVVDPPQGPASPLPTPDAPGRLPWAVLVVEGRRFLVGIVGLMLLAGSYRWIPLVGFGALFVQRGIQLRRLRYWLTHESLVIEQGVFVRRRRILARSQIQAVDLERGLLHRLLGLTEVRVEALGGGETEGALPGLPPDQAVRLRAALLGEKPAAVEPTGTEAAAPAWPALKLGAGEVVLAGLTESRLGAGLAVVGVGFESLRQGAFSGWFGTLEEWTPVLEGLPWPALLVGLAILVFLFSLGLSFVLTALGYWNFTLQVRGDTLEVERGLLTQHRDTVPLERIQAVRVEENPFRRLMGLASVKVVVGGRARSSTESGTNVLLPVGSRAQAFALATWVAQGGPRGDPSVDAKGASAPIPLLAAMPHGARRRRWARAGLAATLGGAMAVYLAGPAPGLSALAPSNLDVGLLLTGAGVALALGLLGFLLAESAWRGLGWADLGAFCAFREGVLERSTTLVPLARLQAVEVVSNPFQRRLGLATLVVPVARPALESDPRALDMDRVEAETLRSIMLRGARATRPERPSVERAHAPASRPPAGLSAAPGGGMFIRLHPSDPTQRDPGGRG